MSWFFWGGGGFQFNSSISNKTGGVFTEKSFKGSVENKLAITSTVSNCIFWGSSFWKRKVASLQQGVFDNTVLVEDSFTKDFIIPQLDGFWAKEIIAAFEPQ